MCPEQPKRITWLDANRFQIEWKYCCLNFENICETESEVWSFLLETPKIRMNEVIGTLF